MYVVCIVCIREIHHLAITVYQLHGKLDALPLAEMAMYTSN